MISLDAEHVPTALAYATRPDEPVQALAGNAKVDPDTWGAVPRSYVRTSQDQVFQLTLPISSLWTPSRQAIPPITRVPEIADILAGFSSSMIRYG